MLSSAAQLCLRQRNRSNLDHTKSMPQHVSTRSLITSLRVVAVAPTAFSTLNKLLYTMATALLLYSSKPLFHKLGVVTFGQQSTSR